MIEIRAVGGYNEVGKNMTAIRIDDDVFIFDMGIYLDPYIKLTEEEEEDIKKISAAQLLKVGAIPEDSIIDEWKSNVRGILITHAHLDHVGAVIFLAKKYKAPIICTPFTAQIIKAISKDEGISLTNKIKILNVNSSTKLSNIRIDFINITHSVPQTVMIALHTKYGIIVYANDFKLDNHPTLGLKPNYKALHEFGEKGVIALICDSTKARFEQKTPSELVARDMLRDVLVGTKADNKAIIITTFSSHLARLKSIIEFGKKINRKIIFLGRSLAKYVNAGESIGIINFKNDIEIVKYGSKIKKRIKSIDREGREKYLMVVTGHQGEPKATLTKIASQEIPFRLNPEDHIIFSCTVIPSEVNIENRKRLEEALHRMGARIFRDIHQSGHASREDLRDLLNILRPVHLIPAHGELKMRKSLADLAVEKGYDLGKTVHLIKNGEKIKI